jgi:hypothetical protein
MVADFISEYEVSNINSGSNSNVACLLSFRQRRTAHVAVVDMRLVCFWPAPDLCSVNRFLDFRRVVILKWILLGISPASEFLLPTFR